MLTWLRRRLAERNRPPRIELEPGGFATVRTTGTRYPIRWANITRIAAFKRDLLTTDEILLAIEVADRPGMVHEVSEQWLGFSELFAPMEQVLGISPSWYYEIMLPAFKPNYRIIYEPADHSRV
jgi:hypothetical protein